MYEVEVKVEAAHEAVRPTLDELGAERLGRVRQVDTYYDAPHRDFAATDEALRVRRETPLDGSETGEESVATETTVAYKGPLVEAESKTREEAETSVADGDALAEILDGLGFEPDATVRKIRERFAYDDYTITLDAVDGLGEFVEVETGVGSQRDVEAAREGVWDVLMALDLDPEDGVRTSYLGLLLEGADGDASDDRQ